MVRKSNKSSTEKTPRKRRGSRRRKESSSESEEPETSMAVTEENVSSISLPRETTTRKEEEVEVECSSSAGASRATRSRRVLKRNTAPTATAAVVNKDETMTTTTTTVVVANDERRITPDQPGEWSEDATFWTGVDSSAGVGTQDNDDEGTTWKIQSSNGSGGEIQKLKICRQRPTDSTGSASPAKECASPRFKRAPVVSEVTGKVENNNPDLEIDAPMDIVDVDNEKSLQEQQLAIEAITSEALPVQEEAMAVEQVAEEASTHPAASAISSSTWVTNDTEEEEQQAQLRDEQVEMIPGLDLVASEEIHQKQDHLWISSTSETVTEVSNELLSSRPESSEEQIKPCSEGIDQPSSISSSIIRNVKDLHVESADDTEPMETSEPMNIAEVRVPPVETSVETTVSVQEEMVSEGGVEEKTATSAVVAATDDTATATSTTAEETNSTTMEDTVVTTTLEEQENEDEGVETRKPSDQQAVNSVPNSAGKCLTLSVSSELAMEQIAKKLNERAARGKESFDEIHDKLSMEETYLSGDDNSPDNELLIEEGEIVSSAAATPDPQLNKSSSAAPTTVVVMPKILDDGTEPASGGAVRRGFVEITENEMREQKVEADEEINRNDEDETLETEKVDEIKADDVQVTVSNDTREVKKKKPIVIETSRKSPMKSGKTPTGPKPPSQHENHKAPRKISIVSADAKALRKSPSPSKKKATEVLFITNLVRPFTLPQLRELLARTGTIAPNGFYIDKIKSKCYVKYTDVEMAIETRHALHGVRWPVNNPKTLRVDFASPNDMTIVQRIADEEASAAAKKQDNDPQRSPIAANRGGVGVSDTGSSVGGGWLNEQAALKPARRVTATVREWDMGKVIGEEVVTTTTSPPPVENKRKLEEDWSRKKEKTSRSEKDRDRRRPHSPEHKAEIPKKMKKKDTEAPARLLDDLFRKTKATPCIYWLPLTAAQIAIKEEMRRQHMAEHKRRLAELRKTDTGSRREIKDRDRDRDTDRRNK